jgi:hypothetical protein
MHHHSRLTWLLVFQQDEQAPNIAPTLSLTNYLQLYLGPLQLDIPISSL